MRLAKLTLAGFKSFADRTEFAFDAPITGIVGPNGCGKSNVVDAIKWVLGERSAKSLRGQAMGDVIFAGAASRKPAGLASVTLTFDNPVEPIRGETGEVRERRALPVDAETVDVERRLHRDGNSEYLINGRKVRLRDIRELFMDTGIGADAYSIIEQGKVDAMLLASSTDRRVFFEEAAGVAKFRARRIEAERKLERAEANLIRVREQLESTDRRLRIVRGQAAKARVFQELDAELREKRTDLALHQYDEIRDRLDGLTSRIAGLEKERSEATATLQTVESEKQEAELVRQRVHAQRQEIEQARVAAAHDKATAEQRVHLTERSLAEATQQLEHDRAQIAELDSRITEQRAQIETHGETIADLSRAAEAAEAALREATEARASSQQTLGSRRAELSERQSRVHEIERKRAALLSEAEAERRRIDTLRDQLTALETRRGALDASLEAARSRVADAAEAHANAVREVADAERTLTALDEEAATVAGDHRASAERAAETDRALARVESRHATLAEMVESHAGLGDAARTVLEKAAAGEEGFEAVVAPLADLIDVDSRHAPAVEAALGAALQAIVVRTAAAVADSSALRDAPGRVTLLPMNSALTTARPAPDHDLLRLPPHRLASVRDLVRCDGALAPALDRLLGRTYLVDSLDAATLLAAGPLASLGARFVTGLGEVLEADGRVIVGAADAQDSGDGLLRRRAELAELDDSLRDLRAQAESARSVVAQLGARSEEVEARRAESRKTLAEKRRALASAEAGADRAKDELARLERDRGHIESERAALAGRVEKLDADRAGVLERAEKLVGLLEEETAAAQSLQQQVAALQRETDEAGERVSAARVDATQRAEKRNAAQRELRALEIAVEETQSRLDRLRNSIEHREARVAEHEKAITDARAQIGTASTALEDCESRLGEVRDALEEAVERSHALGERVMLARERAQHLERDWNSVEMSRREAEVRRETLEERTLEDLSLDLGQMLPYWKAQREDSEPLDEAATQEDIKRLQAEVRKLGNVNLGAIEEEQDLEAKNEELAQQVADIDEARDRLVQLIDELANVSRDRFREVFETINANFAGRDGMFRKIFGGGKAELRLIPDEETGEIDWLESGIEVLAKPPGKEPRTLSQLSGGEKTMTAVALLLAIFESKPSPFCVLDEVDAALDEANVERFNGVIEQFLDRSHFIVITHNKRTMRHADQLYGVTMQERGVSKRVHVRFEDVSASGHIRREQPEPTPADDRDVETKPEARSRRPSDALADADLQPTA